MKKALLTCLVFGYSLILNAQWTHVGPFKDNNPSNGFLSGRLDCILPTLTFNGTSGHDTLYGGSSRGSLWITTDFCNTWKPIYLPDNIPYHGISALTAHPSGYILAATANVVGSAWGAYGPSGNIYQYVPSTGAWTATNFITVAGTTGRVVVQHMRVCPSNASIVLAATSAGIFRSIDGGMHWALQQAGNFENVDFIPAIFNSSGFVVYATGSDVMSSNDLGITFSSKTSITSLLSTGDYTDFAITINQSSPNTQYIYFDAINTSHRIIRLSVDKVFGTETIDDYGYFNDRACDPDRMCVGAYDKEVYFGCGGLVKLNTYGTATFYTPSYGTTDTPVSYIEYNTPEHSDNHDILILPSLHIFVYVSDGGCFKDTYTDGGSGIYTNSWQTKNYNLNISQIVGMSCSEEDTTEFMTGEQDTRAFITNKANKTYYVSDTLQPEPANVLIDKFNKDNFFHSYDWTSQEIVGSYNGTSFDDWPHQPSSSGGDICNATSCASSFEGPEFGHNTLFQNPNESGKIYFGTKYDGLLEFCQTGEYFTLKKQFPPYNWQVYINAMAFSKANKNSVYALTSFRNYTPPDTASPFVFMYNDVDFDNSWAGHNDSWLNISPSYKVAPFTVPEPNPQAVMLSGIAASDWTPSTIWVAVYQAPANPGVKVITRVGGIWQDYSTGIPASEIITSMVYEQGSNDGLYIGTNTNVYYRNAAMTAWILYSGNLPNISMNQLRINYKENTVRVGTFGQGMWKSNLNCPADSIPKITGTITANHFYEAKFGIVVQNATITSGDDKFRSCTKVDFLPNTLITASSTCTAFAFIHGCSAAGGNTFRTAGTRGDVAYHEAVKAVKALPRISVFPNPSNGHFSVLVPVDDPDEQHTEGAVISVYDVMGKLVYSHERSTDRQIEVDMSNAPKGIYILKCVIGDDVSTIRISNQ